MSEVAAPPVTPPVAPASTAKPAALKTSKFKVPGEGNSATISVVTVVVLLALWALITNMS